MPGRIRREDIDTLRRQVDIAEIIGAHTRLQRSGSRLKGLCPFHSERTPSFTVDPERGLYHCFGCGRGGDVYTFLQEIEGLTFVEAVEQLARRVGFELHYEEVSAAQRRELGARSRLVAVLAAAVEFYREQLASDAGEVARRYLEQRGLLAAVDRFELGFAPLEWDALSRHLLSRGVSARDLVRAGVAVTRPGGGVRDRFRGRLMFPIRDAGGEVIGFGGRTLPDLDYGDRDLPKYLNSPDTALYHKGRVLYGLHLARRDIVRSGEVLVCEGYTDVLALHLAGVTTAVATCGTAVGADHIRLLERLARRVVLAFDSDEAGARAAERAAELVADTELEVRVLVLPEGRDPADVVAAEGADGIRARLADAVPVVPFLIGRSATSHDLATPEGRAAAARRIAPLLARVADVVLRHEYTRLAAERLGLPTEVVAAAVRAAGGTLPEAAPAADRPTPPRRHLDRRRAQLEREVLRVALQRPELLDDTWTAVTVEDFTHPRARAVFTALVAAGGAGAPLEQVLECAPDDEVRALVRAIALEDFTVEPDAGHVRALVARLRLARLEARIAACREQLGGLRADDPRYREVSAELFALEAHRRALLETEEG